MSRRIEGIPREIFFMQSGMEWRLYWTKSSAKSARTQGTWRSRNGLIVPTIWRASIDELEEIP